MKGKQSFDTDWQNERNLRRHNRIFWTKELEEYVLLRVERMLQPDETIINKILIFQTRRYTSC